ARVTTSPGSSRKPRMRVTTAQASNRSKVCDGKRGTSVLPDGFEPAGGHAHQPQHGEREQQSGDRQAGREGEVEARESELIDQVRDHVDATAADQLGSGKRAEGPGKRGGDAGDNPGRGQ